MSDKLAVQVPALPRRQKLPKEIKGFFQIVGSSPIDPSDPDSITFAENLAVHAWKKAMGFDKDSLGWATLVLDRSYGKVPNEVKIDDTNKLVEQIISRLSNEGMGLEAIIGFLQALNVDDKYIPELPDYVDAE